jgi:hypothetical protein
VLSLVLVVGLLWRIRRVGDGGLICAVLSVVWRVWRMLRIVALVGWLLCVVVMLEVAVVHLTFPSAAVYHARKMHCHVCEQSRGAAKCLLCKKEERGRGGGEGVTTKSKKTGGCRQM